MESKPLPVQIKLDGPLLDRQGDRMTLRGYDERGCLLWGPQACSSPFPAELQLDLPVTVSQLLVECFQGQALTAADLVELDDDKTELIRGPVRHPIPSGASASTQDSLGTIYYVLDFLWGGREVEGMISFDGTPVGDEFRPQSVLCADSPTLQRKLLLNQWCSDCTLLPARKGGVFFLLLERPELDDLGYSVPLLQVGQLDSSGSLLWHNRLGPCAGQASMGLYEDGSLWVMTEDHFWQVTSSHSIPTVFGLIRPEIRPLGVRLRNPKGYDLGEDQEEPASFRILAELNHNGEKFGSPG